MENRSLPKNLRKLKILVAFLSLTIAISISSCSKKGTEAPTTKPPTLPPATPTSFTAAEATIAFNSFNTIYYSPADKLYYSTTEKKGLAAIWTQAIYWDNVMNIYERTKDPAYYKLITDMYDGGAKRYDNYNWDNSVEWFIYDDMMWWIMSLTRAYEITKNQAYLDKAKSGFAKVWSGSYDPVKGGMFWDFKHSGKNACINFPTVIAAVRLYNVTKDEAYLTKAKEIYAWSRINLFDIAKGRVADHKVGDNNPGFEDYTYNQGTLIGAAVLLYKNTNTQSYLDDAKIAANYTKNIMSDPSGILPAEGDWNEQGVLKAIFAQYLADLAKAYPAGDYAKWAIFNADTAWGNRDFGRGIMHRNYKAPCPTGVVQSYESSSAVAFMQLFAPAN
ncbi:alpha-1,6-mannanase [Pedobacter sp. Leaf41]|jgi:predicted alpha-1,6-mannanase (GH76 family)|uniref:glycoside hydrolase family 76 protein n=1 Tax=Pedobacter sp. Leaf41 TaxID=1736218 RepID=UPI000702B3B0|nr:glycoside hydrolase family 76 protein [Pedobacter sp. Leaf41]KQN38438.1 alpha-1,6-mannanase [Pedobacter sp. Leaf41]